MKVVALSATAQARGERGEGAGAPTSVFCHAMAPVRISSVRVHTLHSGFCLFVLLLRDSENPCPLIDLVRKAKHQGWRLGGGAKLEAKEPCTFEVGWSLSLFHPLRTPWEGSSMGSHITVLPGVCQSDTSCSHLRREPHLRKCLGQIRFHKSLQAFS